MGWTIFGLIVSAIVGGGVTYYVRKHLALKKANTDKYNDAITRLEKLLDSIVEGATEYLDELLLRDVKVERIAISRGPVRIYKLPKSNWEFKRESRRLLMLGKTKQLRIICETIHSVNSKVYSIPNDKITSIRVFSDAIFEDKNSVHSLAQLALACNSLYSHFMRHPEA